MFFSATAYTSLDQPSVLRNFFLKSSINHFLDWNPFLPWPFILTASPIFYINEACR